MIKLPRMLALGFGVILLFLAVSPLVFPEFYAFVEGVPCPDYIVCDWLPILVTVALVVILLMVVTFHNVDVKKYKDVVRK